MSTNVLVVNRGPYDVSLKSAGSKEILRKGDFLDIVVYPGAVFLIEEILPDSPAVATVAAQADPAPLGRDQFDTPYTSEADRKRGEAERNQPAEEAANYKGSIDPDDMTLYDWAFYQKRNLHFKPGDYAIFMKHPVIRDPADGRVLQNPETELAAVDISAYGGPLKEFAQ